MTGTVSGNFPCGSRRELPSWGAAGSPCTGANRARRQCPWFPWFPGDTDPGPAIRGDMLVFFSEKGQENPEKLGPLQRQGRRRQRKSVFCRLVPPRILQSRFSQFPKQRASLSKLVNPKSRKGDKTKVWKTRHLPRSGDY